MSNARPTFEKKELALSASPYVYLPIELSLYVVEYTHKDESDAEIRQKARDRTLTRMPYHAENFQVE